MGAGLLAVKSGFILFIKSYQFPLQINTLERERLEKKNNHSSPSHDRHLLEATSELLATQKRRNCAQCPDND
jgi:hypothetical protein